MTAVENMMCMAALEGDLLFSEAPEVFAAAAAGKARSLICYACGNEIANHSLQFCLAAGRLEREQLLGRVQAKGGSLSGGIEASGLHLPDLEACTSSDGIDRTGLVKFGEVFCNEACADAVVARGDAVLLGGLAKEGREGGWVPRPEGAPVSPSCPIVVPCLVGAT